MTITDLSGQWEVFLDESKNDLLPESYPDRINLPDSTSNAGLGKLNKEIEYGCLTELHKFEGFAWFRRSIDISPEKRREYFLCKKHITVSAYAWDKEDLDSRRLSLCKLFGEARVNLRIRDDLFHAAQHYHKCYRRAKSPACCGCKLPEVLCPALGGSVGESPDPVFGESRALDLDKPLFAAAFSHEIYPAGAETLLRLYLSESPFFQPLPCQLIRCETVQVNPAKPRSADCDKRIPCFSRWVGVSLQAYLGARG